VKCAHNLHDYDFRCGSWSCEKRLDRKIDGSRPAKWPCVGTFGRAIAVRIARNVSETSAPEEIRTPDPQIRSFGHVPKPG
jgi:hypothetical protein